MSVAIRADQLRVEPQLAAKAEITAALDALGDNSAVLLPKPTIIEELGDFAKGSHNMRRDGPGGRDYSIKMAWMPDRQRAFFCGANHGSPHRFNDAWEYDLLSNTWVLMYVPDINDRGRITEYDKALVVDEGWLRTPGGGPGHPGHTWWGLTYDPNARAALWFCAWPNYRMKEKLEVVGKTKEDLYAGPPLWAFHPYEGKWKPVPTEEPWPRNALGASLEYVSDLGSALWQYGSKTWRLDLAEKKWVDMSSGGASLPIETLVYYDTARKLLVAHRGPTKADEYFTWHNKLEDGKLSGWERQQFAEGRESPTGHDARSIMYFDPQGGVGLLFENKARQIWSYDPEAVEWRKLAPQGDEPAFAPRDRLVGYFDAARNVFVVIGPNNVWCYRYKK